MTRRFFFGLIIIFAAIFGAYATVPVTAQTDSVIYYRDLAWSPDGSQIAFEIRKSNEFTSHIGLYDFASGAITVLTPEMPGYQQYPVWSHDGTQIAFASSLAAPENSLELASSEVWIMSHDGTEARALAESLPELFTPIAFSPDDKMIFAIGVILNSRNIAVEANLWTLDVDTINYQKMEFAIDGLIFEFALSPDGTQLAFVSVENNIFGEATIWISELEGEAFTNPRIVFSGGDSLVHIEWSPDGTTLLYWDGWYGAISLVDPATGLQTSLSEALPRGGTSVQWSPDNSQIAFLMTRGEGSLCSTIWSIRPDGSTLTELSGSVPGVHQDFAWSPDGTSIAFGAYPCTDPADIETSGLWLIQADGSNPINLTTAAPAE